MQLGADRAAGADQVGQPGRRPATRRRRRPPRWGRTDARAAAPSSGGHLQPRDAGPVGDVGDPVALRATARGTRRRALRRSRRPPAHVGGQQVAARPAAGARPARGPSVGQWAGHRTSSSRPRRVCRARGPTVPTPRCEHVTLHSHRRARGLRTPRAGDAPPGGCATPGGLRRRARRAPIASGSGLFPGPVPRSRLQEVRPCARCASWRSPTTGRAWSWPPTAPTPRRRAVRAADRRPAARRRPRGRPPAHPDRRRPRHRTAAAGHPGPHPRRRDPGAGRRRLRRPRRADHAVRPPGPPGARPGRRAGPRGPRPADRGHADRRPAAVHDRAAAADRLRLDAVDLGRPPHRRRHLAGHRRLAGRRQVGHDALDLRPPVAHGHPVRRRDDGLRRGHPPGPRRPRRAGRPGRAGAPRRASVSVRARRRRRPRP